MNGISDILLSRLSEYLAENTGWGFPREKWRDMERGITAVAGDLGYASPEDCIQVLLSRRASKEEIDTIARHMTVGETYFIRETRSFEILEQQILRDLIDSRNDNTKTIRIWTAGCCTGEEPYSFAILLDRMIQDIDKWSIVIHGTDINPAFLDKASEGVYGEWSFRGTPAWLKEKYFVKIGRQYRIIPRIKKLVRFSNVNLRKDRFPSPENGLQHLDIISCRNVLMYFVQSHAGRIVEQFHESLAPGGWLMVGASETSHISFAQFSIVNFPGAVFFRKELASANVLQPFPTDAIRQGVVELSSLNLQPRVMTAAAPWPAEPTSNVTSSLIANPDQQQFGTDVKEINATGQKESSSSASIGRQAKDHKPSATRLDNNTGRNEHSIEAIEALAKEHANYGRLAEAADCCRAAISRDRLNPRTHYLLAMILQEQGETAEAIASLNRALYLDSELVLAHFALGNILLRAGRITESRKRFESARALLPRYAREDVLPESEGITAGRMGEIIEELMKARAIA